MPRGKSLGARENQLIAMAVDLVEKRMQEGKATSAEILHYLRLGTTTAQLEKEKLKHENELLKARTADIQFRRELDNTYAEAIEAMRSYSGTPLDEYEG